MRKALLCFLGFLGLIISGCNTSTPSSNITVPDVTVFMNEWQCSDGIPSVIENCTNPAPITASDILQYRRHDWSGHTDKQIEDAYISDDSEYYVNTFSYSPNGIFNAANGDGGDILVTNGTDVRIDFTQNGTTNHGTIFGYWVGPYCGGDGWVEFTNVAPTGSWNSQVFKLNSGTSPTDCSSLNSSYTQWRLENISVPFIVNSVSQNITLPAIISEHYSNDSIADSTAMERVILIQNYGRALWESWATTPPTNSINFTCPGISPWSVAPTAGWYLQDRRCLTDIESSTVEFSGDIFDWPQVDNY